MAPNANGAKPTSGSHPAASGDHGRRDRHVSWMGAEATQMPCDDDEVEQQQATYTGSTASAVWQSPPQQLPVVSVSMVPVPPASAGTATGADDQALQQQEASTLLSISSDIAAQRLQMPQAADAPVQQPAAIAQQPPSPNAAAQQLQPLPGPARPRQAQEPAQQSSKPGQRAATPAVTRRWVRPKPAQPHGWNASTQTMGTVLRRKLPPVPPPSKSAQPLYGSPLFTARSQLKLDTERRLSGDTSPQASPARPPPRKQPSASRLAPPHALPGGQPQANQPDNGKPHVGPMQPGQLQHPPGFWQPQPVAMTPMMASPWGPLPSPAPQMPMTPAAASAGQALQPLAPVATTAQLLRNNVSIADGPSSPMSPMIPAARLQSYATPQHQQQQRMVRQPNSVAGAAQQQPQHQAQHAQQWQQQQVQQQRQAFAISGGALPAPWQQTAGSLPAAARMTVPLSQQQLAKGMPNANGVMPVAPVSDARLMAAQQPQPLQSQPAQPQYPRQVAKRQPSPSPRTQAQQGRVDLYGRTVSMSGAIQPRSRAPSTAGSARGSSSETGGGRQWNSHFAKKKNVAARPPAATEPPRRTQTYSERLKSVAPRQTRASHVGDAAAQNDTESSAMLQSLPMQHGRLQGAVVPAPQAGMPALLQGGGMWAAMPGQFPVSQYSAWPLQLQQAAGPWGQPQAWPQQQMRY